MDIQYTCLSQQTQTQDKMHEMLASKLMNKRCEMFHDITGGDSFLTQDIINFLCGKHEALKIDLAISISDRFIAALGPTYESYCRELVMDDIAAEEQYQKEAAIDMEIEQRRLGT